MSNQHRLLSNALKHTEALTELLDGPVGAPRQLKGHVNPPPAVLHTFIRLQRDARAGGLRDDGYELRDRQETSAITFFFSCESVC